VIFGDQNELRSFSDIWEGGMPGYLIWLNARLYEMKRLLKKSGNLLVHCDWHASHYIKVELDKIFGHTNFRNEVVWHYESGGRSTNFYPRKHDVLLCYGRTDKAYFDPSTVKVARNICQCCGSVLEKWNNLKRNVDKDGRVFRTIKSAGKVYKYYDDEPTLPSDVWSGINHLQQKDPERIGYPTQKPERLLERVIAGHCPPGGTVADFFCGGGTTPAVAQRLERQWIACDQSRVAVALTADRLTNQVSGHVGKLFGIPDFLIEHWGIYEARRLAQMPPEQFRDFVLRAFAAVPGLQQPGIHGTKGAVPIWVGSANPKEAVTAADVQTFANNIRRTLRYQQDNLREGVMLAWAFRRDSLEAAERLRTQEATDVNFVRIEQIRIDDATFRNHIARLSTNHADYSTFLTFVQPPRVEVGHKRASSRVYRFDASETIVLNPGARIINVQWDFNYRRRFASTPGYSFVRLRDNEPKLQADYTFPSIGKRQVACKVQDDKGGEGLWTEEIDVR